MAIQPPQFKHYICKWPHTTIENETNKAREELRQQMSDIIIDTTQKILDEEISKEKHETILKKAAKEL